jgi:hypothetical protein
LWEIEVVVIVRIIIIVTITYKWDNDDGHDEGIMVLLASSKVNIVMLRVYR